MLFLVPTPLGNLKDITLRALEVLESVDMILCEDTRKSSILLKHYRISKPLLSFHSHNEHKMLRTVVTHLSNDKNIALITDAGTPGISDPAFLLTQSLVQHKLPFTCLPGPTALIPALVSSAFPLHAFSFYGFPPPKKGRPRFFENVANEKNTTVLYESPHRIEKTLVALASYLPDRPVFLCKELSKMHEAFYRGTANELLSLLPEKLILKGEFVIVIKGLER